MAMNRRAALLALCVSSCATRQSIPDGTSLSKGQGLLAMKLLSNAKGSLAFVPYAAESTVGSRLTEGFAGPTGVIEISELEQYFVIPVNAGEYMWSRFAAVGRVADLHTSTRFVIKPGEITYIGNVRTFVRYTTLELDVFDRDVEVREHLREKFPKYYETMRFNKSIAFFRPKAV